MKEVLQAEQVIEKKAEKQEKKQEVLQASRFHRKGHTLFEYNLETMELDKAKFEKTDYVVNPDDDKEVGRIRKKVLRKSSCLYVQNLNWKRAVDKINKMGFEVQTVFGKELKWNLKKEKFIFKK